MGPQQVIEMPAALDRISSSSPKKARRFVQPSLAFWMAFAHFLGLALALQAGVVQTLDGKRHEGAVSISPDGLRVKSGDASEVAVPLNNLQRAVFTASDPDRAALGPLTGGWMSRDVGNVTMAGRAGQSNDTFSVKGAAASNEKKADGFHFIYQTLIGDAEIVARVTSVEGADLHAWAFLTLRESLAAEGPFASIGLSASGQARFQARAEWQSGVRKQDMGGVRFPHWLRLVKRERQLMAYQSANGRDWKLAGATNSSIGETFHIGMTVSSPGRFALGEANFDQVLLTASGLQGDYFVGEDFKRLQLTRVDPRLDFWWGVGTPADGLTEDHFSVRWTGQLVPPTTDDYTFHLEVEDAPRDSARLWVKGQLVAQVPPAKETNGQPDLKPIRLISGRLYDVKLEYVETEGPAAVRLAWAGKRKSREVIPTGCLVCIPRLTNPAGVAPAESTRAQPASAKGLLLTDGSFVAGEVISMSEAAVKVQFRGEREMTVLPPRVATAFLRVPRRLPDWGAERTGVLLASGDLFEGEIRKLDGRIIRISSVLLGLRSFSLDDIAAVFFRTSVPVAAQFEVRTKDGSALRSQAIVLGGSGLTCDTALLGRVQVPAEALVEIRQNSMTGRTSR